jgi:hypothetical protein
MSAGAPAGKWRQEPKFAASITNGRSWGREQTVRYWEPSNGKRTYRRGIPEAETGPNADAGNVRSWAVW